MKKEEFLMTLHSVLSVTVSWIWSIFILYVSSEMYFKTFSLVQMWRTF